MEGSKSVHENVTITQGSEYLSPPAAPPVERTGWALEGTIIFLPRVLWSYLPISPSAFYILPLRPYPWIFRSPLTTVFLQVSSREYGLLSLHISSYHNRWPSEGNRPFSRLCTGRAGGGREARVCEVSVGKWSYLSTIQPPYSRP